MVVGVLVVHQSALLPLMLLAKVGDGGSDFAGGGSSPIAHSDIFMYAGFRRG